LVNFLSVDIFRQNFEIVLVRLSSIWTFLYFYLINHSAFVSLIINIVALFYIYILNLIWLQALIDVKAIKIYYFVFLLSVLLGLQHFIISSSFEQNVAALILNFLIWLFLPWVYLRMSNWILFIDLSIIIENILALWMY
jgi:hypothetical protein